MQMSHAKPIRLVNRAVLLAVFAVHVEGMEMTGTSALLDSKMMAGAPTTPMLSISPHAVT